MHGELRRMEEIVSHAIAVIAVRSGLPHRSVCRGRKRRRLS